MTSFISCWGAWSPRDLRGDVLEKHDITSPPEELLPVLNVCLAPELEVLVQSLLALSTRATPEHLSSLGRRYREMHQAN